MKTLISLFAATIALFVGFVAEATVTVSPTELNWTVGEEVKDTLTATSDNAQLSRATTTWSLGRGSALPDGVTFKDGAFAGTPEKDGAYSIAVTAEMSATVMVGRTPTTVTDTATDVEIKITVEPGKPTYVEFSCVSPTLPTDGSPYPMTPGSSVMFTVSPKGEVPSGAQYAWYQESWDGKETRRTLLGTGSLTCQYTPTAAGDYYLNFYAYTGSEPDFEKWDNIVGGWGYPVSVKAPAPTKVDFTPTAPKMPEDGSPYIIANGDTVTFAATATPSPSGTSMDSVNLAWYRVYEDEAAGTARELLADKAESSYEFTASYCFYAPSMDYTILLVAYTGTTPDFSKGSNIIGQNSWAVTEMKRPDPVWVPSIEPGSYEWDVGETKTISIEQLHSTASMAYKWFFTPDKGTSSLVGTASTYSFKVSESGQLRAGVYNGTSSSTALTNFIWNITAKGGGGGSVTVSPTTLADATVGEAYSATISISGVSSIMGGGSDPTKLPPGLSCDVTAKSMSATVSGTPTTAGIYTFPLLIQVDKSTTHTENITITVKEGGGGEVMFSRESPASETVAMTVGETQSFSVTASGTTTGVNYSWGASDSEGGTASVVSKDLSCEFTPTKAGTYYVVFTYEKSDKSNEQVYWIVTVSGGEPAKPTIESADPSGTTVEMTEGETRKFSITVKNADRTTQYKWYAVSSTGGFAPISEASGTEYEFTNSGKVPALKVEVASTDGTVYDSRIWTIRTKSGTTTFTRESPRSEMVEMTVGETQSFSVTASGTTTGIGYNWSVTSDDDPSATVESTDLSCTFTPTKAGAYTITFMYVSSGGSSGTVEWAVTVMSPEPETGLLPILGISNEEFALKLQNRASIWPGVFTNQIVRKDGTPLDISVTVLDQTPGDVEVTEGGLVTGTMTDDLDGELMTIETVWTQDAYSSFAMTNVLTFAKRKTSNTAPYLAGSSPAAAEMTAYLGSANLQGNKMTVFAYDEEVNTLTYKWFFDGVETAYAQNWFWPTSAQLGEEGSTHTVACYANESDGVNQDILLKTWTLTTARPTFAILGVGLPPDMTVGGSFGQIYYRLPENEYVVRLDVVRGELPPGIITLGGTPPSSGGVDARFGGCFRKAGTYSFTLRGLCSNGETADYDITVTVSGTDSTPKTWNVGSSGGSGTGGTTKGTTGGTTDKGGSGGATTVSSITMALMQGAAAGDTMEINSINGGSEDLSTFRYLKGIAVTSHCTISLTIGAHVPDLTAFVFESGKDYKFKLSLDGSKYLLEDDSYGALAPIAKMNEDTPYQLDWSLGAPYFIGLPELDADGYLSVAIGLTSINESSDLLHLPDNEAQRTVVFENATFSKNVKIVTDGVLPATITFAGTNMFAGTFNYLFEGYQDELKMIVPSDATVNFAGGSLYDSKLGGLVLEPGATLKFDPSADKLLFYGYRLYMPKAGQAKVRFVLTGTRTPGAGAYMLSARYMGDDDPMNVIEIVPQPGDTTNYRVYRGAEQALFFEAVATPNAGGIVWTKEDNPPTANGTLGSPFEYQFKAHGGPVGGSGTTGRGGTGGTESGTGGSYSSFVYSITDGAYAWTRDTKNTFDNTIGTRELMQASYRVGASDVSAPVEIGFPFPCGTNFISTVDVGANRLSFGDYVFFLQDKGFLATLTTLSHVYIDRQESAFTVRWGEFVSATLTPDGQIRVAFGPAADTRAAVDPQVPLYWIYDGSAYGLDLSSAEPYAGSNDIVVTPSCPPGLRLEGDTLTGVPLVTGVYSVNVKVVADRYYETNRTFTVAIAPERFREDAPVINVTKAPVTAADGYVHLGLGDSAEFEASVGSGQQMRWTLDGAPLAVSGGSYVLTAPATRTLDAAGAKIHCLAVEADDGAGRWNFSVRKSWQVVYNRPVYIDAAKARSAGGGTGTTGGTGTDVGNRTFPWESSTSTGGADGAAGGTTGGGGTTADGLTPETAFGEFPEDLFKYLLTGDEVIVAPGTYAKPIDFLANTAEIVIRAADENARPVIDLTGNTKGYTRCFRQGYYSVEVGSSGSYEQIYQPLAAALVQNFVLKGGVIEEDIHDEDAMQLYPESSVNYYGVVGGGVFGGSFQNCLITGCSAKDYGGAAYGAFLTQCVVENCSAKFGGGCANCMLDNCTVVGNAATSKAGGIDGQCTVRSSILYANEATGKLNDYDNTTTPVHLVPYVPTLADCFTTADGDPAFCADYHLANGSPATGKGAFPTPDATACLAFVEIVGGGTVTPNDPTGTSVAIGESIAFTTAKRTIKNIYTNGVEISAADLAAAIAANAYTLADVRVNTTVTFEFANATLVVDGGKEHYATVSAALADARSGDTITVDPGNYVDNIDVSAFAGKLLVQATDAENPPVISGGNVGRCVIAKRGSYEIVFKDLIFKDGYAAYTSSALNPHYRTELAALTDAQLLADGFGGGVFGGRFENCTIRNCTAQGGMGGGAFGATLVKCTVTGNVAGYKTSDDRLREVLGGGVFGGYVDTCGISSNSVKGCKTQVYCLYDGAGTYDTEVRNSFVWDNFIDCGSSSSKIASETAKGENGVIIHTEEKAPTEARLEAHTTPIPQEGTEQTYSSKTDAETAAAKQVVEISTEVAKAISDQKAYEDLFEIKSVETSEGSGEYYNKPTLKEEVVEVVETQVETALTADAEGNPQSAEELQSELTPENQTMTKTLKTTTPGLYYALEFSSDMSEGSFKGERHLATGSGSIKLQATSLQTPNGFWRINVYTTPDGD